MPVLGNALWVVVPAAGIGKRFGSEQPKQYASLAGSTVIGQTLSRLARINGAAAIVAAVRADDDTWPSIDARYSGPVPLLRAPGGAERCHSVLNALDAVSADADDDDWALVHDAVRPCVRLQDIDKLLEQVRRDPVGGLTAVPVRDTMKRSDRDGRVGETVQREGLWHALTPQVFRYGLLRDVLRERIGAGQLVTDEAQAMEQAGHRPLLVPGRADNLKITQADDLALAEHILAAQADRQPVSSPE